MRVLAAVGVEDEERHAQPLQHRRPVLRPVVDKLRLELRDGSAAGARLLRLRRERRGLVPVDQLLGVLEHLDRLVARRLPLVDDAVPPLHLAELDEVAHVRAHHAGVGEVLVAQLHLRHDLERLRGGRVVGALLELLTHRVEHVVVGVDDGLRHRDVLEHVRRQLRRHQRGRRPHRRDDDGAEPPELEDGEPAEHRQDERLVDALQQQQQLQHHRHQLDPEAGRHVVLRLRMRLERAEGVEDVLNLDGVVLERSRRLELNQPDGRQVGQEPDIAVDDDAHLRLRLDDARPADRRHQLNLALLVIDLGPLGGCVGAQATEANASV